MNVAAATSACTAAIAILVALFSLRIAGAPGSREQRWFSVVAFCTAVHALGNLPTVLGGSDAAVMAASRAQFAAVLVHVGGWVGLSQAFIGRSPRPLERVLSRLLLAAAVVCLVPGATLGGPVLDRPYPPFGVVYRQLSTTWLGDAFLVAAMATATFVLLQLARASLAGVRHAALLGGGIAILLVLGVNDALATALRADLPVLLDLGFAVPVLVVGWVTTSRFVESSHALGRLRRELEATVAARTQELSSALEALHQSEKLAALGQFANGVAHEVNSPAAVVTTNLRFLGEAVAAGSLPADARGALGDALSSMQRINDLVRKLVDAGRIASIPGALAPISLARVARKVLSDARTRAAPTISLDHQIPEDLHVRARRESLELVLATLVSNAVEAVSDSGRVEIEAERNGGTVRITVSDDGVGMAPDVLRRAFDLFFTTKPAGRGSGLGLPVARGLIEAHGGTLRLRSGSGAGTTAAIELPHAPAPAAADAA